MTVQATNAFSGPLFGNAATTVFPFSFAAATLAEIKVIVNGVVQTTGFTVVLNADNEGGSVTFDIPPAVAAEVLLVSDPSFEQETSFKDAGQFLPSTHDQALDRAAIRDIHLKDGLNRSIRAPEGEALTELPSVANRAGKFSAYDALGNPTASSSIGGADASLRTDLAASAGAALVALLASTSAGAVAGSSQQRARLGPLYPEDFGAVGDGVVNDTAAINAAIAAAASEKRWLDGRKRSYGVIGKQSGVSNMWIRDLTLKQLAPGASASVITFEVDSKTNVDLRRFAVNRNGDGTNGGNAAGATGSMGSAKGINILNCTYSHFEDLEAYGNDTGTGIWLQQLDKSNRIIRPYAHDILGINPAATDQNVQGIRLDRCIGVTVESPRVHNLTVTYNAGASTDTRWARGIGGSGCEYVTVSNPQVSFVGEAIDISSQTENKDIVIVGGSIADAYTWGVKFANLARRCKAIGVTSVRVGDAGFVDSSGFNVVPATRDANQFISCTAVDCGDPAKFSGASGFTGLAANGQTYTNGVIFRDCVATDSRGTPLMKYGFYNEKVANANCLTNYENCQSSGHTVQAFFGEHEDRCHVSLAADQSIPNNTVTEILWDTDLEDTSDMHSLISSTGRVNIKKDGVYLVVGKAFWNGNATGIRRILVQKNGGSITGALAETSGQASNHAQSITWVTVRLSAGDTLGLAVLQNSGGGLTLKGTSANNETDFIVQRLTS